MDTQLYEKVIKDAIAGEIEAKKFYQKISERIKDTYLKEVFTQFSKEEENHEKILSDLLDKGTMTASSFSGARDYSISETIEMPQVSADMDLKNAIGLAMKSEELAMKKYQNLAEDCDDPELKSVFNNLASMEKDHKAKMEDSFVNVAYPEVW